LAVRLFEINILIFAIGALCLIAGLIVFGALLAKAADTDIALGIIGALLIGLGIIFFCSLLPGDITVTVGHQLLSIGVEEYLFTSLFFIRNRF
jgi:hypothetical protein